jgi:HK97 family phage prohead protease
METKTAERNGVRVGLVSGYIATWDIDSGLGARYGIPERIHRGAYAKDLEKKRAAGKPVQLKFMHKTVIGGFPIENVIEDDKGLFGRGEVNLEVKEGHDTHALARQGVYSEFSVGHLVKSDRVGTSLRDIYEAEWGEGSIVDHGMNGKASITEVKSQEFAGLPIAPATHIWDSAGAEARVGDLRFSEDDGNRAYLDQDRKLLFADVIEGRLHAVPQALESIVFDVKREGADDGVKRHIERYYAAMSKGSPFEEKHFYDVEEVKSWTTREFEAALASTGAFSKGAVKWACQKFETPTDDGYADLIKSINAPLKG